MNSLVKRAFRPIVTSARKHLVDPLTREIRDLRSEIKVLSDRINLLEDSLAASYDPGEIRPAAPLPLRSALCKAVDFESAWYKRWMAESTGNASAPPHYRPAAHIRYHRKNWEWAAILQAAYERGVMVPGNLALGFAVGNEPLPAMFAKYGMRVVATDLDEKDDRAKGWQETGQHAARADALLDLKILNAAEFRDRVMFRFADMNNLSSFEPRTYDLVWSSCALEHLGTLEFGVEFLLNSSNLLKVGGIGIHTTEFNVSSLTTTVERGANVIYRRSDLRRAGAMLTSNGFSIAPFDFSCGTHEHDLSPDLPPYYHDPTRQHIKLLLGGYISTSILLIVQRVH